jgi:hypothetical protein
MPANTPIAYSAELTIAPHSQVTMKCLAINETQYVCETVPTPPGFQWSANFIVGLTVCAAIVVVTSVLLGSVDFIRSRFTRRTPA